MDNISVQYEKAQDKMASLQKLSGTLRIRSGSKHIPFMEHDTERKIVSMIEFSGKVYVATEKGIYIIKDDELHRLEFAEVKE